MNDTVALTPTRMRTMALVAAAAMATLALFAAPLVHAQDTGESRASSFRQSALSLHASNTGTLAESITCSIFGILDSLGVMHGASSGCSTTGFPGFPFPGGGNGGTTTPQRATLSVVDFVSGGTSTPNMFTLHVTGGHPAPSTFAGSNAGTNVTLDSGTSYSVTADPMSSYTSSYSPGCSGSLSPGTFRTCVVTNTFFTPTSTPTTMPQTGAIKVLKMINAGNGTTTAISSDFMLHLKNASTSAEVSGSPQMGSATGTTYMNLPMGTYMVSESGGPSSYSASWSGDCDSTGKIMLTASSSKTCTITNKQPTGSLKIVKMVTGTNASSTSATSSDFMIHVWKLNSASTTATSTEISGSPMMGSATGTTFADLPLGDYRITETGASTSSFTPTWGGDCDANGMVHIWGTGLKTCTITNALTASSTATTSPQTGSLMITKIVSPGTSGATTTATSSDFAIHVFNASSTEITGSPKAGSSTGVSFMSLPFGTYHVTETGVATSSFTPSWSGSCDSSGMVSIAGTSTSCTLTNTLLATSTASTTENTSF